VTRGHIRKRSRHSYRIAVSGGVDAITGRRIQVFRTIQGTRRDAERALTSLQSEVDQGRIAAGGGQRLSTYLTTWLESTSRTSSRGRPLAPTTKDKYVRAVNRVSSLLGHVPLNRLTPRHVERVRDCLLDEGRLGPNSVADVLGILSQALARAASQGLVVRNVASRALVTRPAAPRKSFRLIDPDLGRTILHAVRDTPWDAPAHLALGTTMRREEILALQWSDIDLEDGSIQIIRALTYAEGKLHLGEPKTNAGRRAFAAP